MLILLFILALILANITVLCVILGSQRISTPRCGRCLALVAGEGAVCCSSCDGQYIDVGIAAGSVMRPPKRGLLCLGGLVVVLACMPFMIMIDFSLERYVRSQGNLMHVDTVLLSVGAAGVHSAKNGAEVEVSGIQVLKQNEIAEVLSASLEISLVKDEQVIGTPLRRHAFQNGGQEVPDLSRPFTSEECVAWLKQQAVFPDRISQQKLQIAADCIIENIDVAFLGPHWADMSVLTVRTPFKRISSISQRTHVPLELWQILLIRGSFGLLSLALLVIVITLILHYTRGRDGVIR